MLASKWQLSDMYSHVQTHTERFKIDLWTTLVVIFCPAPMPKSSVSLVENASD